MENRISNTRSPPALAHQCDKTAAQIAPGLSRDSRQSAANLWMPSSQGTYRRRARIQPLVDCPQHADKPERRLGLCVSVFNRPLTRLLGITRSAPDDWKLSTVGWVFTIAYVFLGLSTGLGGKWQDRVGPRVSGVVAALCFSSGFFISALGIWLHRILILYIGYGVIGGCGLGLGYNTPVSPLIKWFPDRRGTATGIAIMGFGGGAIIAAPLSNWLMAYFSTPGSVGIAQTFLVLGALYLCSMLYGSLLLRLPAPGWQPKGALAVSAAPVAHGEGMPVEMAVRQKQFYLIWSVLLLNVTAGIGVLGQASAMMQAVFEGLNASTAASFVALLSLFNMGGRLI